MKKIKFILSVFLGVLSGTSDAQVRDVRGYEIIDSGYIGRASGMPGDVYWLDNDRIIFIGGKRGEIVEPVPGLRFPKYNLYVWDLKSSTVTRHYEAEIANGNLCLFNGFIRLSYTSDYRLSPVNQRWHVYEGMFGNEKLRLIDKREREEMQQFQRVVNRFTCKEHLRSELPNLGYRVEPLLDGEFVIQEREPRIGEVVHWTYRPREGKPVLLNMTREVTGIERYFVYGNQYVLSEAPFSVIYSDTVVRRAWLMDRKGRIRDFTPPSGPWMRGSTSIAPTRRGLFLVSHAIGSRGGNGAAGGYLLDEKGLYRVIEGRPESFDVSPDGCHVAISISDRNREGPIVRQIKKLDLCTKGKQTWR